MDEIYCYFRIRVLRIFRYIYIYLIFKFCRRIFILKVVLLFLKYLEFFRINFFCISDLFYFYLTVYWNVNCFYFGVRKMFDKKKSKRKVDIEELVKESLKK